MDERHPRAFLFVLLPDFPLYGVVPATEALRIANQNSGLSLYDWRFVSARGGAVRSSNGMAIEATLSLDAAGLPDCIIICSGNEPTQHLGKPLLAWIRRLAAHGVLLGALDTGAFALGAAGVLRDRTVTLHWEARPVFLDMFPNVSVKDQIVVIDRNIVTAAGGTASLDLMLTLIDRAHGARLAQVVANAFVHGRPRPPETLQRPDLSQAGDNQTVFRRAVRLMTANIAFPLGIEDICAALKTSRRCLERSFATQIGRSPAAYYIDVRLQTAREQLFYSNNPVAHIAEVAGFQSNAHFCRSFRKHFGVSPSMIRKEFNLNQRRSYYPTGSSLVGDGYPENKNDRQHASILKAISHDKISSEANAMGSSEKLPLSRTS